MKKHDFEARREALLKDIREVMDDVEELYRNGVEAGSEEGSKARAKLEEKLAVAKERLSRFEEEAGERLRHHAERAREKYEQFEEAAQERLKEGKERFAEFEADAGERLKRGAKHADEVVHEKPYYAMRQNPLHNMVFHAPLHQLVWHRVSSVHQHLTLIRKKALYHL